MGEYSNAGLLKVLGYGSVNWIQQAQDMVRRRIGLKTMMNRRGGKFYGCLRNHQFGKDCLCGMQLVK
jgi:hypothetical protein